MKGRLDRAKRNCRILALLFKINNRAAAGREFGVSTQTVCKLLDTWTMYGLAHPWFKGGGRHLHMRRVKSPPDWRPEESDACNISLQSPEMESFSHWGMHGIWHNSNIYEISARL